MKLTARALTVRVLTVASLSAGQGISAAQPEPAPLRQSSLASAGAQAPLLTLRDASRDDRWIGLGVRDVRWELDGSAVYFRWNRAPEPGQLDAEDPWFRVDRSGRTVEEVGLAAPVPGADPAWSPDRRRAVWSEDGAVWLWERGRGSHRAARLERPALRPRFTTDGAAVEFESGEALYELDAATGALAPVARVVRRTDDGDTDAARWLAEEQRRLLEHVRRGDETAERAERAVIEARPARPQAVPVAPGVAVDQMQRSPDGRFVTFRSRSRASDRPPTEYVDYVDPSGYAAVHEARSKVGEPRDVLRLGVVRVDPTVPDDSVVVVWVELPDAGGQATVPHGPVWSPDGRRALVQWIGEDHQDVWIAELDPEDASLRVITHDHDDAWIGGPPVQANYLQPALMEWIDAERFVFASERSGWSHLYLAEPDGTVSALTSGAWEVRGATLSADRSRWLIQASREHPADDHLYVLPAAGGELVRLTEQPGRHEGRWSPDGGRVAVVHGASTQLPDLFLADAEPRAGRTRVTVSGTDAFYRHPLVAPTIVSFEHPDGGPLWAALFEPVEPAPERPAVLHIHGGGYRQFAHNGWSVYGWALHLGLIHYLLQEGYTVLDFDYRGSAGFGRDYRTDIARSMGISDADGAVAAARWLVDERGIDPERIGLYGVSYGGFLTLMAQFRHPGVFSAGIARAAVSDWAHYSDGWTSRILGVPHEDPEAYRRSSPIYYAEGLEDALLITHGLVDDNVHFQDTARLIQRLIELEKEFEVMIYPVEPHTIQTEPSRFDYVRRAAGFFDEHLKRGGGR